MSPSAILKKVKTVYPSLDQLPKSKLRLVEQAIVYASRLALDDEVATSTEHQNLMHLIGPKPGVGSGAALRAYRLREDYTQVELAKKSGIPQANLSAMESGKRSIGLITAKKLAKILGCDFKKLI